jgi:hypothetical protein
MATEAATKRTEYTTQEYRKLEKALGLLTDVQVSLELEQHLNLSRELFAIRVEFARTIGLRRPSDWRQW